MSVESNKSKIQHKQRTVEWGKKKKLKSLKK